MRRVFDCKCDNGHVNEKFVDVETNEVQCPDCELKARKIVTPVTINGGDSWKETRKWVKKRESHMRANKA